MIAGSGPSTRPCTIELSTCSKCEALVGLTSTGASLFETMWFRKRKYSRWTGRALGRLVRRAQLAARGRGHELEDAAKEGHEVRVERGQHAVLEGEAQLVRELHDLDHVGRVAVHH